MSTFYVRKNGSGTHTDIQAAIYDALDGDTIDIGEGTFDSNIEMYKSVILKGAGKNLTFLTGKLSSDTFAGCSYYAGEDVINVPSTSGMFKGRRITGTGLVANCRISQIVSDTQFKVSTATTGSIPKTGVTWNNNSSTITLPSATAVVVGMKVDGIGVSAFVTAYNATTRVVTLSTPTTQAGAAASLLFKPLKTAITVTMPAQFSGSIFPATIQIMNVATNGLQIKDLTVTGFDGNTNTEASGISMTTPVSSGVHQNWLIDNCNLVANGDSAFVTSPNLPSNGGTIQNCTFSGKTFTGSEPTEVPAFSSFIRSGIVLSTTTMEMPSVLGIYGAVSGGSPITGAGIPASTIVTSVSGNVITLSKVMTAAIGSTVSCTFSNVQFTIPNVARQLVIVGNSGSVSSCLNTTFKNNLISGQTGAVISASGSKTMFNTAVTVDTVGGLIEGNTIDGIFGAGDPNPLLSNFAIRSRGASVIVQNNVNKTSGGRQNSGFYVALGTSINNTTIDRLLVEVSQSSSNSFMESMMEKGALKANSKVSSHPVFSDESNWKLVNYVFKHDSSSRRLVSSFRSFDSSKKTKLKSNMKIGDKFELQKIIISKSDRSHLVLKRSEISGASGFDFTLVSDGPVGSGGGTGGGGGPTQPALLTRTFSEATPGGFVSESASFISNGNLVLPGSSASNAVPWWNKFSFDIPTSLETATQFNGLINYKMKLTISSSDLKSGGTLVFSGGYGASVSKDITATDITNGYVEISGLYIRPQYQNQLALASTGSMESISLTISKMEINPV